MPISETLSVTNSSVLSGQPVSLTLVLTNTTGADRIVTEIAPYTTPKTSPATFSVTKPPYESTWTVPDGGTLRIGFGAVIFSVPQPPGSATQATSVNVGAIIYDTSATGTTPTVTKPTEVTILVTPSVEPPITLPQQGQANFSSNLNSAMKVALFH